MRTSQRVSWQLWKIHAILISCRVHPLAEFPFIPWSLKTRKYHQTSFWESSWICLKFCWSCAWKIPNSFVPNSFGGLPFWSFWKHELPRVTSFTFLRYKTKTKRQETKPKKVHFNRSASLTHRFWWCSFMIGSDEPNSWNTFHSFYGLPDVFFGSLEWFYWNIPSTLGDASCELGEHLKHSRIFFPFWMIEPEHTWGVSKTLVGCFIKGMKYNLSIWGLQ